MAEASFQASEVGREFPQSPGHLHIEDVDGAGFDISEKKDEKDPDDHHSSAGHSPGRAGCAHSGRNWTSS